MPDEITMPEAAYAVGTFGVHHTDAVVKSTENKSVDLDGLRRALHDLADAELTSIDKQTALAHLKAHARALDIADDEVDGLVGEIADDAPNYMALVESAATFVEAEELLLQMMDADAPDDLVDAAYAKVVELAKVDREVFTDQYDAVLIDEPTKDDNGLWHFTARVAQADKPNLNKRIYPRAEFEGNLKRVNRLCKAGRFTGRDGHAGWLSDDKPSEICIRYDAVSLHDNDLIMEGVLIPTQAGESIATLWANGVQTEWSIVGYGKGKYEYDDDGNLLQVTISDYILDGCDPVRRGAANTKTLKMKSPKDSIEGTNTDGDTIGDGDGKLADGASASSGELTMGEELNTEVVPEAPKAPEIDLDAIKAQLTADAKLEAKAVFDEAKAQAKLEAAKDKAISDLADGDELVVKVVTKFIEGCETVEDIAAAVETAKPIAEQMKKPKVAESTGVFIHEGRERERFMWDGSMRAIDRPETIQGVKEAILEGLEDNGRQDASNKAFTMRMILDNYEKDPTLRKYLETNTRRGFADTATTTSALGTTIPMVLPIIRQMLPQLIPYDIAAVVPIDRPEARVYFYDPQYIAGTNGSGNDGSNLDDSSVFDTAWADHTENDTKSQIGFTMTYQTVTAAEKAIYWDYTSALMQDMQAYYSLDVEASMMNAAVNYMALEINMKFIETMAAGAGLSGTFNTGIPASGFQNLNDWLTWGMSQALNRASSDISKKMLQSAGWIVTGPTQATLFEASNAYSKLPAGDVREFGTGLRQVGTWQSIYRVYVADWAEKLTSLKNKMLIGYSPRDWNYASAVFCPYIPLYISPVDPNAAKNTIAHSVASRNAMKVLQANGLYKMTISSAAGEALTYTD